MRKLLLALILSCLACSAQAYDSSAISVGLGAARAVDNNPTIGGKIEWRGASFEAINNLSPIAGLEADASGGVYGYGGFLYDLQLSENFYIAPSFAVGLYAKGNSVDLGGVFNYRSAVEFDYAISNTTRAGISISHKSNASMYDHNPGTEEIMAVYSFGL